MQAERSDWMLFTRGPSVTAGPGLPSTASVSRIQTQKVAASCRKPTKMIRVVADHAKFHRFEKPVASADNHVGHQLKTTIQS